jgi:hypothetical protein
MAYTNIDDPSAHFQAQTYTGSGAPQDITNTGNSDLQPDMVWTKIRTTVNGAPNISDSTRGVSSSSGKWIRTDSSTIENDDANGIRAFNSDGFKTGDGWFNGASSYPYIAWQWKANGGTTASNSVGDITSTVQANTDAGFSIVTYTGNGSANQTIGHGLGTVPKMILFKNRSNVAYWYVYHVATGNDTMMYLNLTNAAQSLSSQFSTPTTTTFNVSNENSTFTGYNTSGNTYLAYVFSEVQGYSKIGSFEGNSNADGPFIYTGFQPAFVMIKPADISEHWVMHDSARDPFNKVYHYLFANEYEAEAAGGTHGIDLLSNGFKIRTSNNTWNASSTITYIAFAEHPFVTSTGIPTTAR